MELPEAIEIVKPYTKPAQMFVTISSDELRKAISVLIAEEEKNKKLIDLLYELEPELRGQELDVNFDGYFVHWNEILKFFPGECYGSSPLELISNLKNKAYELDEKFKETLEGFALWIHNNWYEPTGSDGYWRLKVEDPEYEGEKIKDEDNQFSSKQLAEKFDNHEGVF